jgi:PKD repeat protein
VQQVLFNSSITLPAAENYLWIFNDGGTSTQENPKHQFGDTGIFTITLIASSTGCRDTFTIENYVRNDPPIARYNLVRNCDNPYEIQFRD